MRKLYSEAIGCLKYMIAGAIVAVVVTYPTVMFVTFLKGL